MRELDSGNVWTVIKDADREAFEMFRRHYSFRKSRDQLSLFPERNRNQWHFVGPGGKLVLRAPGALFVWRKFISADGQQGVNCAVFRNETRDLKASELIRAADAMAWQRWPGERLYTYVNSRAIQKTRQPGRCFIKAGWRYVMEDGRPKLTKSNRLHILEMLPEWMREIPKPSIRVNS